MSPYPWGTRIFEPLVITFSLPRVFEPRPAFVPRGTAGNSAAVAGRPSGTVRKSFHWSASMPPMAPLNAWMKPMNVSFESPVV